MGFGDWISDDLKSRNFNIYGQWIGLLGAALSIAFGASKIISSVFGWAIFSIIIGGILFFVEFQWLFKCFRTSDKFEKFIRAISHSWFRSATYIVAAVIQFLSTLTAVSSLIAAGIVLLIAGLCYLAAFLKGQAFSGSKTLGAGGMAQMIV